MNSSDLNCHIAPNSPFGLLLTPRDANQSVTTLSVQALRALAREHHLLVLRGFHSGFSTPQTMIDFAAQWGEIMIWPFGAVLDVVEHADSKDHVFDSSYMPLHWDGMYKPTVPEFVMFHCATATANDEGGRTTFVDTTRLLADVDAAQLEQWKQVSVTYRIKQVVHYGGEVESPLVIPHPNGDGVIMRYNEPPESDVAFQNQHSLELHGVAPDQQAAFVDNLRQHLHDPRYYYAHHWDVGDVVVVDNFALLHGREGFTARSPRHLQRIHIQRHPVYVNPALKVASKEVISVNEEG